MTEGRYKHCPVCGDASPVETESMVVLDEHPHYNELYECPMCDASWWERFSYWGKIHMRDRASED